MKVLKIVFINAFLALFVYACNQPSTTNQPANTTANKAANTAPTVAQATPTPGDDMTSVRAIYAAECARCHGINGEGGTVTVLKKRLKVPSLKAGHALDHADDELAKIIKEGKDGEMPAFGDRLKPEEINGLVRLIRQEFQRDAAKNNPAKK